MNQKLLALLGHAVLFAATIYLSQAFASVGFLNLFLWSGIVIGLWAALGTPRAWRFSTVLAALQPVAQCVALVAIIVNAQHQATLAAAAQGLPAPRSSGAEFFVMVDMLKSFVVVLATIALARWVVGRAATR